MKKNITIEIGNRFDNSLLFVVVRMTRRFGSYCLAEQFTLISSIVAPFGWSHEGEYQVDTTRVRCWQMGRTRETDRAAASYVST